MDKEVENGYWEAINKVHYNLTLQVPYSLLEEIGWSWVYVAPFKGRWSLQFATVPPILFDILFASIFMLPA